MPFLSLFLLRESTQRQHRDVPRLRRLLAVVRARQPGDGRPRGPAPRPDRGQRRGPPLHRPLLPGRLQGHPQRRRHRRASPSAVPIARWQDGTPNVLFVGRHEPRKGLLDLLKAHRILRRTGYEHRLLVVGSRAAGARGAPLRRDARPPGGRVPRPRLATPRRPSSSGPPTSSRRRRPAANRSGSSCSRRWPPAPRSSPRTSTATRASSGAAARACWSRRTSPRSSPTAIARLLDDPALRARDERRRPAAGRGVQLAAGDRQGRGVLRLRHPPAGRQRASCPPDFRAPIPQAPPVRARPSASSDAPRPPPRVGQRQPPDPGRVGDDQAGHDQRRAAGARASA